MSVCNFLDDYLEDDIIGKVYRNDFNFTEKIPTTEEYMEVIQCIKKQEQELQDIEEFKRYLEIRNIKDSIEAEEQFKLGFKTAIKIIIESYHS